MHRSSSLPHSLSSVDSNSYQKNDLKTLEMVFTIRWTFADYLFHPVHLYLVGIQDAYTANSNLQTLHQSFTLFFYILTNNYSIL
jgi:hypothetical protein